MTLLCVRISTTVTRALEGKTIQAGNATNLCTLYFQLGAISDGIYDASCLLYAAFMTQPSWHALCSGPGGSLESERVLAEHAIYVKAISACMLSSDASSS